MAITNLSIAGTPAAPYNFAAIPYILVLSFTLKMAQQIPITVQMAEQLIFPLRLCQIMTFTLRM